MSGFAARPPPVGHIASLDGLRAVSFGFVFLAHAGFDQVFPAAFGVTVFFFLSGYLITTLLRQELEANGRISIRQFYLRRVFRILPPFYLVLATATLLAVLGVWDWDLEPAAIASQALHYSNIYAIDHGVAIGVAPGTEVLWSLAVEEHFYLVFPVVFLVLVKLGLSRRRIAVVLTTLCMASLAWSIALVDSGVSMFRTYTATDVRFASILWGCVLALAQNPALDMGLSGAQSRRRWTRRLLPAGLSVLLLCFVVRDEAFRETLRYTLQGIALMPVFVVAVRWPRTLLFRPLNLRWVAFVGKLSYSLYLVHFTVIYFVEEHIRAVPAIGRDALALAISLAIAGLIYRFVEQPFARLRKRLSPTRASIPAAATAAPTTPTTPTIDGAPAGARR